MGQFLIYKYRLMRKVRKNIATRQVIHIVGEGLTELFYFSHLKKFLGYRYSISPRLFENNSIEKIDKKIKELLNERCICNLCFRCRC